MRKDAKALLQQWFDEVWNQGREEMIDELLAKDAPIFGLGEGDVDVRGPSGFKPFFRNFRTSFPDLKIRIEDCIAEADKAVARVVFEGTHSGDGLGVPATGRRVRVAGIVIVYSSEGKLIAGWNSWDKLGLLRQIGAIPAPPGPDRFLTAGN
jgi:steroid delta-isomerase-like uncharacterized protein